MQRPPFKHCRKCGAAVVYRVPDDGDTKERGVCPACHTMHYENPLNVVGTIPCWGTAGAAVQTQHRAAQRQLDAARGLYGTARNRGWCAARETDEEAGAHSSKWGSFFHLVNIARVGQVHLYYRATLAERSV
jgi:hypothetical protein